MWEVNYDFYGVGQGLFCTGALLNNESKVVYQWIYDCGTNSKKDLLREKIKHYAVKTNDLNGSNFIDLICLSHFDHDHISGVVDILSRFKVGDVLLPYIPMWKRLVIAFEEKCRSGSYLMDFLIDPVAFLQRKATRGIGRIIYVSSPNDAPDEISEIPDNFISPRKLEPNEYNFDEELPISGQALIEGNYKAVNPDDSMLTAEDRENKNAGIKAQVLTLEVGACLQIFSVWEFVPYNDSCLVSLVNAKFKKKVLLKSKSLLLGKNNAERHSILTELKEIYDDVFGCKPYRRNVISLFLYTGPILSGNFCSWVIHSELYIWKQQNLQLRVVTEKSTLYFWPPTKSGVLYTGDGYLNTLKRINSLIDFLGEKRMKNIHLLQVMHHGAKGNWRSGLAKILNPEYSLFSSDPSLSSPGHPHSDVAKDFWNYNPIQVDKVNSATLTLHAGLTVISPEMSKKKRKRL